MKTGIGAGFAIRSARLACLPLALWAGLTGRAVAQDGAPKDASPETIAANEAFAQTLPKDDPRDRVDVGRGLVAAFDGKIMNSDGETIFDAGAYDFLKAQRPAKTVNPSLWRHAGLSAVSGLFKVTDRVYQLRGFDLANMDVIEGDTGLIVVDPLTSTETARAALEFYFKHRPRKPVVAVIYTHSHIDHFGGVRGVVDEAEVKAGKVTIYAPQGFLQEAVSENVLAGNAMLRRAQYQAGMPLARSVTGQVGAGLGIIGSGRVTISLIAPTVEIAEPYETKTIDGVDFEFQLTPDTEAPAEMNFYLPRQRVLCMAENAVRTMHNLLTPRGAQVRDGLAWSRHVDAALARYGDKTDVLMAQHLWPMWGGEAIRTFLADTRDSYAFLNNRALFLMNQGLTIDEVGDAMRMLPGGLKERWYTRGYYGTPSLAGRAVYQRYLGFYDANPANLDPHPPVDTAKRYVEAIGGPERALSLVEEASRRGDYRWAAELGKHLVFAAPDNARARGALADAFEQLGYQAESAIWRNIYLSGALELRSDVVKARPSRGGDMARALTPALYFDLLAVRLDSDRAQGHDMTFDWTFPDLGQSFLLTVRNGVMTWREQPRGPAAEVSVSMDKATLDRINARELSLADAVASGQVTVAGDRAKLAQLMSFMATFDPQFDIVTP